MDNDTRLEITYEDLLIMLSDAQFDGSQGGSPDPKDYIRDAIRDGDIKIIK